MIYLSQYLCPDRHCIVMLLWDGYQQSEASAESEMTSRMADYGIRPWCGICGSRELRFEHRVTNFKSLAAAAQAVRPLAGANALARSILGRY